MENIYKTDDILSGAKAVNLKLNEILLKVKEFYARVATLDLANEAFVQLKEPQPRDIAKMGEVSTVVYNLYQDIHVLKDDFINDILKNKSDELDVRIVRDSLESHFKALNPFFMTRYWLDLCRIVSERNNEIRNNPTIANELKVKEKKAITNIIYLTSKYSFDADAGVNPFTEILNEKFKNIEKLSKGIYFFNKELGKLNNDKEKLLENKDGIIVTQKKSSGEIQADIDRINLKIVKKDGKHKELESKLEKNKLAINKSINNVMARMKKSNQDESLDLDINKFLAKNKEKARYSYNLESINRETSILYNQVNELIKQSTADEKSDISPSIENNNSIISDDQVDSLELKQIDEHILVNTKNIYIAYEANNSDALELLYNEFFILHNAKHNKIISNLMISNEISQGNLSLDEKRLAKAYEYYKKTLNTYDLENKIKIIDKFNSTEKDKILSYVEKNKIFSMIDSWQAELNKNALIEKVSIKDVADVTVSKVEILSDSINGMADKAYSADNDLIIQGVNQTFNSTDKFFANKLNQ